MNVLRVAFFEIQGECILYVMKNNFRYLSAWFANRKVGNFHFLIFLRFFKIFWRFFQVGPPVGKLFRYQIGGCHFENMKVHIIRILLEHMQSKRSYIKYSLYFKTMLQKYRNMLDPLFLKSPHFTTQNPAVDRQPGYRWGDS